VTLSDSRAESREQSKLKLKHVTEVKSYPDIRLRVTDGTTVCTTGIEAGEETLNKPR
jgi:hypothetical protein